MISVCKSVRLNFHGKSFENVMYAFRGELDNATTKIFLKKEKR